MIGIDLRSYRKYYLKNEKNTIINTVNPTPTMRRFFPSVILIHGYRDLL